MKLYKKGDEFEWKGRFCVVVIQYDFSVLCFDKKNPESMFGVPMLDLAPTKCITANHLFNQRNKIG